MSFLNRAHARIMGLPWVYEQLRVALLGGGPAGEVFGWLGDTREDVLIDIGCGMGTAMDRLGGFTEYHGFDTDPGVLRRFRQRPLPANVYLYDNEVTAADLARFRPSKAVMIGLLHHLPNTEAESLLSMLAKCGSLRCAITLDPVFVPGRKMSNLLCRLDRGRHVRAREQYETLVSSAGFDAAKAEVLRSGNGLAFYFCTLLVPASA